MIRKMFPKRLRLSLPTEGEYTQTTNFNTFSIDNQFKNDSVTTTLPNIFTYTTNIDTSIATKLLQYELQLNEKLRTLSFEDPVSYVYHPVEYAYNPHAAFVQKFCQNEKKILMLGLNPGPWGMCQTGVPFGEVKMVRDWYKINGHVSKPEKECPDKEIIGLNCPKSEESGKRLYALFRDISETPENFLKDSFLYNYCPLALMSSSGFNITPAQLMGPVKKELEDLCNETLLQILQLLKVELIIAIGRYAEQQARSVLEQNNLKTIKVIYMLHPSPRVPGNNNWPQKAKQILTNNDLIKYFS